MIATHNPGKLRIAGFEFGQLILQRIFGPPGLLRSLAAPQRRRDFRRGLSQLFAGSVVE